MLGWANLDSAVPSLPGRSGQNRFQEIGVLVVHSLLLQVIAYQRPDSTLHSEIARTGVTAVPAPAFDVHCGLSHSYSRRSDLAVDTNYSYSHCRRPRST